MVVVSSPDDGRDLHEVRARAYDDENFHTSGRKQVHYLCVSTQLRFSHHTSEFAVNWLGIVQGVVQQLRWRTYGLYTFVTRERTKQQA